MVVEERIKELEDKILAFDGWVDSLLLEREREEKKEQKNKDRLDELDRMIDKFLSYIIKIEDYKDLLKASTEKE